MRARRRRVQLVHQPSELQRTERRLAYLPGAGDRSGLGNTDATPASFTWTIDTAAPSASITGGPSDPSNDAAPTFTFTADEAGSSFECRLDGGAFATCASPHGLAALTEGSHTFTVRAIDGAGNTGPGDSRTWTVDLTAPETTISSGPSDPTADTFADFAFDSSEAGSTFRCELDGGGFSACSSLQSYGGLTTSSHLLRLRNRRCRERRRLAGHLHLDDFVGRREPVCR